MTFLSAIIRFVVEKDGRIVPALITLAAIATIATAYTAQFGFGIEPCILCLYQRVPFAVAGVLGIAAIFAPAARALLVTFAGAVFLVGSAIAVYHVGVEQHWWVSAAGCGADTAVEMSFAEMKQSLTQKPPKPCDEIDWTLFGLSMATYNVFYSFGLGVLTLLAAHEIRKQP